MTRSFPALAVSFGLLGLVAWLAISHPAEGSLFTSTVARVDANADLRPAQPAPPPSLR